MEQKPIRSALVSVFDKDGLHPIIDQLNQLGVTIYSTGGTQAKIESWGYPVTAVEELTSYPSILDGRVKTLHPKVFGGLLARREEGHLAQLESYDIPEIDLVIVDLYPFEKTVASGADDAAIIEKIDIGGISLIRAAAKNYKDVVVVPSQEDYQYFLNLLEQKGGITDLEDRQYLARRSFSVSSHYDHAIHNYFDRNTQDLPSALKVSHNQQTVLRYGENPHQPGAFYGSWEEVFEQVAGTKGISFNNLVDIDAAIQLMREFKDDAPTFAVLKHTNPCGLATRPTVHEAWKDALAGDPVSAFGGILICNQEIDLATAEEIHQLFYEVLIAPSFSEDAFALLTSKKKRILLQLKDFYAPRYTFKSMLNGVLVHQTDLKIEGKEDMEVITKVAPNETAIEDLVFANKAVKHIKSNTIVLAKNKQLVSMGSGQTSRVDALRQAIHKAGHFGFDLNGAVMASDAFFPFPDCVEIAHQAGITAVIQPGGSIRDQESVDYCDANGLAMVKTGIRHFRH